MKKFFRKIRNKVTYAAVRVKAAITTNNAEGYIDVAVKVIIGVVVGGVILTGLYALFNTTVIPTLTNKITQMFSYSGT